MDWALICVRWLHFTAAMIMSGASLMRLALGDLAAPADSRLRPLLIGAALLTLVSALFWLLMEGGEMGSSWTSMLDPATLNLVLTQTDFGTVWMGRLCLCAIVAAMAILNQRRLTALTAALTLASLGLVGHAAMQDGWVGILQRLNHASHLLAGGIWIGGMLTLFMVLSRPQEADSITVLRRFSMVAQLAAAVVILTGLINSILLLDRLSTLFQTAWGTTLAIKVGMVVIMLGLAALNRFRIMPFIAAGEAGMMRRLRRNIILEIVLGLGVLTLASLLGTLPPGGYSS